MCVCIMVVDFALKVDDGGGAFSHTKKNTHISFLITTIIDFLHALIIIKFDLYVIL